MDKKGENTLQKLNSKMIDICDINEYIDEERFKLDAQSKSLFQRIEKLQTGSLYTNQKVCKGIAKCEYGESCVYCQQGIEEPIGYKCPYEQQLQKKYFEEFMNTFDVRQENSHEISLIIDLVQIEILLTRSSQRLQDMDIVIEDSVKKGDQYFSSKQQNPILDVIMNLQKQKQKILEQFKQTRQQNKKDDLGVSTEVNDLIEKIKNMATK